MRVVVCIALKDVIPALARGLNDAVTAARHVSPSTANHPDRSPAAPHRRTARVHRDQLGPRHHLPPSDLAALGAALCIARVAEAPIAEGGGPRNAFPGRFVQVNSPDLAF